MVKLHYFGVKLDGWVMRLEGTWSGILLVVLAEMGTRSSYDKANEWDKMSVNRENMFVDVYYMETTLVG